MNASDNFSIYYAELLDGRYDCVDRMVLNAYYSMGQTGGGLRCWWRELYFDDSTLDDKHLAEMAGTFSRRVSAYCNKHGIPLIEAQTGERKHELAEAHVPDDPEFQGLFLVITGRAPAPVWEVKRNAKGQIIEVRHRKTWPHVKHYYFHLIDAQWGHVTIRMCGYPPFGAQIILNGHEWVERQALKQHITVAKSSNCFIEGSDFEAVERMASTLQDEATIARLREVCERWIYSACLCFALTQEERQRSRFAYQYSVFQLELSRHLLFQRGATMDGLSTEPDGFTLSQLAETMRARSGDATYSTRNAAYDLTKLRGKALVHRRRKSRRYEAEPSAVRTMCAYLILREQVIKPLLAGTRCRRGRPPKTVHPLDQHYMNLRDELDKTFETLGLAA